MTDWVGWIFATAATLWAFFGLWAAGHALMYKREPGSALGWLLTCLFLPYVGPLVYVSFGINRIGKHADRLGHKQAFAAMPEASTNGAGIPADVPKNSTEFISISNRVTPRPVLPGNHVQPFLSGDAVYAQMMDDIKRAEASVMLATYIFRTDRSGRAFIKALKDAMERGVDVRVLIDGAGERYTLPRPTVELSKAGVRNATFIPPRLFPPSLHLNLRNHRKLLIVDGHIGYAGGMNIGDQHVADKHGKTPVAGKAV